MNSMHKHNESQEDYLEAILRILQDKGYCRSIDVAEHLSVAKPSVSVAVAKLRSSGLVEMDSAKMILLTEEGKRLAENIYAKHRFFKDWLVSLGVSEERAEDEACSIEHDISEDTFGKIVDFLSSSLQA